MGSQVLSWRYMDLQLVSYEGFELKSLRLCGFGILRYSAGRFLDLEVISCGVFGPFKSPVMEFMELLSPQL